MDCAREIRGSKFQGEGSDSPGGERPTVGNSDVGDARPIVTAPGRSLAAVSGLSGRTCSRTSSPAIGSSEITVAPASL